MFIQSTKILFASIFLMLMCATAFSQGVSKGKIEPERDSVMELQSQHNLEVARYYITKRKGYEGGISRLQEIIDTHPTFSRMDEVLYLMGEAHMKLKKPEEAEKFYSRLLKDYPESEFVKKAKEQLDKLKTNKEVKS